MPKKESRNQTNQYDKILKENLENTLPAIIRDILKLDIVKSEELPDDVQHTKERKPDALKKVTNSEGETYVLHVEFQVKDEKEMIFRMAEYSIMLLRRYQLPLKQYVIYLRDNKPLMQTHLETNYHKFSYKLICVADSNYKLFLKSNNPEVKMLGILANFGKDDNSKAIRSIVEQIKDSATGNFAESRYFKQLRIFVHLRGSLELEFKKVMESVSTFFKEENDFLYQKGEQKKSHSVVVNLIKELGLSDERAAKIAEVSLEFVKQVREELKKKVK